MTFATCQGRLTSVQAFNLVPTLSAAENITLPLDIARRPVDRAHFDAIVAAVGLETRLHHRPSELSGGQQQRVACARALVAKPAVIFADEPTGNLDSTASAELLGFLRRLVDDLGQSVVMVTHDPRAAAYAHRVLFLADDHGSRGGQITVARLVEDTLDSAPGHVSLIIDDALVRRKIDVRAFFRLVR